MVAGIIGIAFDCPDADSLADFYVGLTGWVKELGGGEYAAVRTPEGILLVFQTVAEYVPPVWPWKDGRQQQMAHIDYFTDDLPAAEQRALELGATRAEVQYYDTSTVMLDPAGHPFCLTTIRQ